MDVRVLTPARLEFLGAVDFYESEALGLGGELLEELEGALESIMDHPEIGAPYEEETRRVLLERFPYSVIYEVRSDHVLVIAIAHQKRRPGYWRGRL